MLMAERARPGPERAEGKEAAMLLIVLAARRGRIVLGQAAAKIGNSGEIVLVGIILADESDAQRRVDGRSIYASGVRFCEQSSIDRVEPLDAAAETGELFLRQVGDRHFDLDPQWRCIRRGIARGIQGVNPSLVGRCNGRREIASLEKVVLVDRRPTG